MSQLSALTMMGLLLCLYTVDLFAFDFESYKREVSEADHAKYQDDDKLNAKDVKGILQNLSQKRQAELDEQARLKKQNETTPGAPVTDEANVTKVTTEIERATSVLSPTRSVPSGDTSAPTTAAMSAGARPHATAKKVSVKPNLRGNIYISPPAITSSSNVAGFSSTRSKSRFGIKSNTWVEVELKRQISSADSGTIELILSSDLIGRYKSLPANTTFIAQAQFNAGTDRMDLYISKAVTPDDNEVAVVATAYDLTDRNGLAGMVLRDKESEVNDALGNALVNMGKGAVNAATPNNIAGSGVSSFSNDLIDNENRHRPKKRQAVIIVGPQKLKLKIEQTF